MGLETGRGAACLSDEELARRLKTLAHEEKVRLADLVRHLLEFERRRLAQAFGFPSLFIYCTQMLGIPGGAAYRRIRAVRVARKWPEVIDWIERGEMSIESIALVSAYLDEERGKALLEAARGKSSREVEFLIAALFPRPEVRDCIRALSPPEAAGGAEAGEGRAESAEGTAASGATEGGPARRTAPEPAYPPEEWGKARPLSSDRVHFSFTGSRELLGKVERARGLLRHKFPVGRLEDVVLEAVEVFLDHRDPDRREMAREREAGSTERRGIPRWIKDRVRKRDGGRCAFVGREGRCPETEGLEFDHLVPFALGGRSGDPKNVRLLCRSHNQHNCREVFGDLASRPPSS